MARSYTVRTYGCQMNVHDSERMAGLLEAAGYRRAAPDRADEADVAFNQIDTAADRIARTAPGDPAAPRALARIYDDVVHVVVPAASSSPAIRSESCTFIWHP